MKMPMRAGPPLITAPTQHPEGHPCWDELQKVYPSQGYQPCVNIKMTLLFGELKTPDTLNSMMGVLVFPSQKGGMSSVKSVTHERKSTMTPTQRDSIPAKSPVSSADPVASHSPFDSHQRPVVPGEVYRPHLPPHLDPSLAFHRVIDPGSVEFSVFSEIMIAT